MSPPRAVRKDPTPLDRLCDLVGVQRRWEAGGEVHESPEPAVMAVLRELGAPLAGDGPDALEGAARAVRVERAQRLVEPVAVSRADRPAAIAVRLLETEASGGPLELRVVLEDGSVAERRVEPDEIEWEGAADVEGRRYREGRLLLGRLDEGYHDVTLRAGSREATARLVQAPGTTWAGPPEGAPAWRSWGLFAPLHALRTARDRGVGDLSDLAALARFAAERGADFVGTLPLLPVFVGDPGGGGLHDPSPYAPVSRLFWNELHLDLERAPGLEDAPEARRVLESADHRREAERLRGLDRVDHRGVAAHVRRVLEPLARAVAGAGAGTGFGGPLEAFLRLRPDALEYARFRARCEAAGAPWPDWPGEARDAPLDGDQAPAGRVAYHLYVQWAMAEQIEALAGEEGADLYLDLPLGCHRHGFDVWRRKELFATRSSGGAPPDAFFAGGQDWGFPPLDPGRSREDGHEYFARSLRHLMGACAMLRLDHVMSLHRLFWVPAGGSAADGVYVRYPHEELWAVLCLESRRHECEVVGEDLGTVPPEVPAAMERHGARRMWVLPFEIGPGQAGDGEPAAGARPPPRSVASLNTHDLPPFAAWWRAADLDRRVEDGHLDPADAPALREERARWRAAVAGRVGIDPEAGAAEALGPVLELLADSPARVVLVNLEDLWLETGQQNVPGTAGPENWTLRARRTLEEADTPGIDGVLERVDRVRRAAGPDRQTESGTEGKGRR